MKQQRFDALTGLKGLFSLVIVFFHTLPMTPLIQKIPLTSFVKSYGGSIGNCFFFVTSGFLIALGYRDRIRSGGITFGDFLVKRLRKLYPLYLITNLVSLLINIFRFGAGVINIRRILFTLLLQNGGGLSAEYPYNGPSWFISALFVCYLAFFFIACHSKHTTAYRCLVAAGILWGYSILSGQWTVPLAFAHHGDSFFGFFTGCALAEVYPLLCEKKRRWFPAAAAGILVVSGVLMLRCGVEIIAGDSRVAFAWLICPLLIYLALFCKPVSRILRSRPIRYLGDISFSVYLWHFVVYDCFRYIWYGFFPETAMGNAQYLLYLALMLPVSALSHRFLERKRLSQTVQP